MYLVLFQLGGYTLLHIAMANVGPFSPTIVELLLQYGADPNSGGRRLLGEGLLALNESDEDDSDSSDDDDDEEEEEEEEEGEKEEGKARESLIAGRNEGSAKVTPLHMLCTVPIEKPEDKDEVRTISVRKHMLWFLNTIGTLCQVRTDHKLPMQFSMSPLIIAF